MSALATAQSPQAEFSVPRLFEPSGSTLEDLILGAWEDLGLGRRTECPVCGEQLSAAGCKGCGSELT